MESAALQRYITGRLHPCRILLDAHFVVVSIEGAAAIYGLSELRAGDDACECLPVLYGLDVAGAMELPFIAMPSGVRATIMTTPQKTGMELLIVNVTEAWHAQRDQQQKANELHLLSEQQRRLVVRLERAQTALRASRDEAEQASRLKSEFIARMSHEFRTPLSAMIGYVKRLNAPTADNAKAFAAIERGATHLLNLVENLLDEAQLRSGKILIQARPTRIESLLHEVCDVLHPLAEEKGLRFVQNFSVLPATVAVDDLRLRQILINLIGNSIKYTVRGKVSLTATWKLNRLNLTIADQGPGISKSAQDKIFNAFWRDSNAAPGAGLGLSISRSLVEAMDGRLDLQSEPGLGTTISINLPAAQEQVFGAEQEQVVRVLLAEDNLDVAELIQAVMQDIGYQTFHALNARDAVRQVAQCNPTLMIVDRNLSDADGFELTRCVRASGFQGPIVMLTASNLLEDRDRAAAAGCDDFLVKSAGVAPLIDSINRLLHEAGKVGCEP